MQAVQFDENVSVMFRLCICCLLICLDHNSNITKPSYFSDKSFNFVERSVYFSTKIKFRTQNSVISCFLKCTKIFRPSFGPFPM